MKTIIFAALVLSACTTDDGTTVPSTTMTSMIYTCGTIAACNGAETDQTHSLCAAASPNDVSGSVIGSSAAEDWEALWKTECTVDQGNVVATGESPAGEACVDPNGGESRPFYCDAWCTPTYQPCEP